ncbi:MAG: diguanylate cyclase [Rhodospirillaceae bacterium]|nr:diguanylate cyclase [Rhodospirillales bacterium]
MIRLANVLIVDDNSGHADALVQRLGLGNYHAVVARDAAHGLSHARQEHPDLVLAVSPDPISFSAALKTDPASCDIPVIVIAETVTPDLCARALEAGVDDVIAIQCDDDELFARMRPLVRLATMHAELRYRAEAAQGFCVVARDRVGAPENALPAILLIGDEAARAQAILADFCDITLSDNLYEAEGLLTQRNFDAALIAFDDEPEGLLGFCSQVRNNPRLFNLPMVVLSGADAVEAYRRGATRVLPRPVDAVVLRSVMLTLVRRQQLRWTIRGALNDSLQGAARDEETGVYSRAFLDAFLANRLEAAKSQDRHLAVVFFASPNVDGVRRQFGDDAALHLTQQVGQWITGLLRAEDLTAAYGPAEFCVVLPDTPLAEAEVVMHRIAGVLAYTDFAVREVYQPVKVWVQVGCTDSRSDDDMDSLLARARKNLD